MLIKAITLFRLRAVSDNCVLSEYSPSRPFLHNVCVFDRLDTPETQSVLCLSVLERAAHVHTHARKHTHTHAHTRANTHTHTHTHTHTLQPEEQHLSCGLYFQRFIKHVQQFSNCKDGILQQSTDDWSDSDVKFWSGRNECAPLWREGSCARRNTAIIFRS